MRSLTSFLKRRAAVTAVLILGVMIMPFAIEKGGIFPWIALGGLGSAMLAAYLWAYLDE